MKPLLIVSTSDAYAHIVPIWIHLYQTYWNDPDQRVEIVGYKKPDIELPENFTFVSLGKQSGNKKDFSNDLRPYFARQEKLFFWFFEDSFIRETVRLDRLEVLYKLFQNNSIGRIELTGENQQHHTLPFETIDDINIYQTPPRSQYRLSTQPAIWNREYLLRYLTPNLSPWDFECQRKVDDEFKNVGMTREDAPIYTNEGVTRHDIFAYNLNGIPQEIIKEMEQKGLITQNTSWNPPKDKIRAYLDICKRAATDESVFATFKSHPDYNYVLEHTSVRLGEEYFKILKYNNDIWLAENYARQNDSIGDPIKKQLISDSIFVSTKSRIESFYTSPTTVQYLAIASKISWLYRNEWKQKEIPDGLSIIEIGGGYGGQCWALSKICNWHTYEIIDLPEVNELQKRYLKEVGLVDVDLYNQSNYKDAYCVSISGGHFFISNYALSEIQEPLQTEYIKNIALNCEHGYITSNATIPSLELIKEQYPDTFKILPDIEGEAEGNFIAIW